MPPLLELALVMLSVRDVATVASTCKSLHVLVYHPVESDAMIWEPLFMRDWVAPLRVMVRTLTTIVDFRDSRDRHTLPSTPPLTSPPFVPQSHETSQYLYQYWSNTRDCVQRRLDKEAAAFREAQSSAEEAKEYVHSTDRHHLQQHQHLQQHHGV